MAKKKANPEETLTQRNQRRRVRPHATPGLWRGLIEWSKDGRLAGFLLAIGSALVLGYLFLHSTFQVTEVEVRGNQVLPGIEAIQHSLAMDRNLFLLDTSAVAYRLMQVPYVENARVERLLPNQVRLTLWERFPSVSWWPLNAPQRYLVFDNGLVLGPEKEGMTDLIYIMDLDGTSVEDGVDAEAVRTAQQVFSRLYNDLGFQLYAFEYRQGEGITAVSAEGWKACFGTSAHLEKKVRNLVALLNSSIQFRVADLRLPDQIRYH